MKLGHLTITADIMAIPHLSWVEKTVLAGLKHCLSVGADFNQSHFAEETGIGLRTVVSAIRVLKAAGHYADSAYIATNHNNADSAQQTSVAVRETGVVDSADSSERKEKEAPPSFPPFSLSTPISHTPLLSPQEKEKKARRRAKGAKAAAARAYETQPEFLRFLAAYPIRDGKAAAFDSWCALSPDETLIAKIHADIAWRKTNDRKWLNGYPKEPATYLNQHCWDDRDTVQAQIFDMNPGFDVTDPNADAPAGWRKEFRTGQYCEPGSAEVKTREVFHRWVRESA